MAAAQIFEDTYISGKNLVCTRGIKTIFENLCFNIKNGEILHIKGANGIGKSTLLRGLTGFLPFAKGRLTHNDKVVSNLSHIGVTFLNHLGGLHPDLTPNQHALFWAKLYGDGSKKILPNTLQASKNMPTHTLSTGQRQQLLLHQLNHKSLLWILDEPFLSLDQEHMAHYAQVIHTHLEKGGITLLVSHQNIDFQHIPIKIHHMDGCSTS